MPRTEQSASWIGPKGFAHNHRIGANECAEDSQAADMALAYGPYRAAHISSSILVRRERERADATASF